MTAFVDLGVCFCKMDKFGPCIFGLAVGGLAAWCHTKAKHKDYATKHDEAAKFIDSHHHTTLRQDVWHLALQTKHDCKHDFYNCTQSYLLWKKHMDKVK